METVKFTIDGINVEVPKGTTVLEAARGIGIKIPTLCYLKDINKTSSCRVCLVDTGRKLIAACSLEAENGMAIKTNTKKVRDARRTVVELLLSNHKRDCLTCIRNKKCELQNLAEELNIRDIKYEGEKAKWDLDITSKSIVRDPEKCILCGRCISVCGNIQSVYAVGYANRGFKTKVSPPYNKGLGEYVCVNCGQCIMACPVGAIYEKENIKDVWKAIEDPEKYVIVQTAPAVRVALGEEFNLKGSTTGKMVSALKKLGFDKVFDTDFGADLTVMEEGTELLERLESGENLPLMTSCCPGWVKFAEHFYPDMIKNLSTCKSPSEMEGALIKTYFAKRMGIDPEKIVTVSIMPCVGKKFESSREELGYNKLNDVDIVLTTRELAKMIKECGIDYKNLKDEKFDNPFGESTGAGVIFGATGGVTEAALRTIFELTGHKELDKVDFKAVRGMKGIKEAEVVLPDGRKLSCAVVNGLSNARKIIDLIKCGKKSYQFIEVMACPGGCITGGGQPIVLADDINACDVKNERAQAIYDEDKDMAVRKSHKNPYIKKIYDEFLIEPNSSKCHEPLHTKYTKRNRF